MTDLKDLNQRAEVPEAGFADKAATASKLGLTTTYEHCTQDATIGGHTTRSQVLKAVGVPLEMTLTPTFDAWWECEFHLSNLSCTTASWNYCYVELEINPSPNNVGDPYIKYAISSGHLDLIRWNNVTISALWALDANTAYTVKAFLDPGSGSWEYARFEEYCYMYGRAWAR